MTRPALIFERFDDAPGPAASDGAATGEDVALQRARAEAFAEGYAAGQTASAARADAGEQMFRAAVNAMETELASLPARLATDAAAALRIFLERLFPALAAKGFAAEAAAAFEKARRESAVNRMEVFAPAEWEGEIARALAEAGAAMVEVKADPALEGARARAEWAGGGLDFDLEEAMTACLAALDIAAAGKSDGNGR
ncbi:hypothetical protein [Amphiplicatus metriothermophilus]|uniref:Flagellar assembly protein FliH n=1 Tax=Amphiplicatus metriothermophilus TaxID=1519374 RepID=A0A239PLB6_9PROT|nr:hypothetical protein [Amphiplicatus metriothermophilus]MBB5517309.1 hypothetical protein [Amphiplicatus metriothermophilus]SNT68355.1 hypothetical protein SAMN06297382_0857 [Amphiplicatus metriothermophilus]